MTQINAKTLHELAIQSRLTANSNVISKFIPCLEEAANRGFMQVTIDRYITCLEVEILIDLGFKVKRESSQKESCSWTTISWA